MQTSKPSPLKKLQIIQNIQNLIFQIIFIFSDLILIKQIIHPFRPPLSVFGGKQILEKMLPGEISNDLT